MCTFLVIKFYNFVEQSLFLFLSSQDFEACAQALHRMGYSIPDLTAARGTSAGGLIVGAVCNRSPGLFKAAVLRVKMSLFFIVVGWMFFFFFSIK